MNVIFLVESIRFHISTMLTQDTTKGRNIYAPWRALVQVLEARKGMNGCRPNAESKQMESAGARWLKF